MPRRTEDRFPLSMEPCGYEAIARECEGFGVSLSHFELSPKSDTRVSCNFIVAVERA